MSLGHWLTIYFKKVLILFLREMKKVVRQNINFFFPIKFFFNELLTNVLRVFVSIFLRNICTFNSITMLAFNYSFTHGNSMYTV